MRPVFPLLVFAGYTDSHGGSSKDHQRMSKQLKNWLYSDNIPTLLNIILQAMGNLKDTTTSFGRQ